jgi:hypothetical protein
LLVVVVHSPVALLHPFRRAFREQHALLLFISTSSHRAFPPGVQRIFVADLDHEESGGHE